MTNLASSVIWYREVLDLTIRREYEPPDKRQRYACLLEPRTGLEICLVEYSGAPQDAFNEFIPGLDHLEFLVAERTDLDEWASRSPDSLGIAHSGVKEPAYTRNAMLYLPRPGQHPARVLLEGADPVTAPPSRCWGTLLITQVGIANLSTWKMCPSRHTQLRWAQYRLSGDR